MRRHLGPLALAAFLFLATLASSAPQRGAAEQQAIAVITRLGGRVDVDETKAGKPVVRVSLEGTAATDADLRWLGVLGQLRELDLSGTAITDDGLVYLKRLTQLRTLICFETKITGAGLVQLYGLTNLQTLLLSDTRITDEAVQKLQTVLPDCKIQLSRSQARSEVPTGTSDRKAPAGPARPGKAVDELIEEFAAAEHAWQQGEVARKLVALGDKKIVPRMEKYLDTADRRRRCNAALVLAGLGDKRGVTTIIAELQDKQPRATDRKKSDGTPDVEGQIREDRYYAALLLGQLGKKEAVPALVEATTDRSINYQAAISLGEIGDRSAIPALQRMARDFPAERLWAGYALAALGESEGFDILTEAALAGPQWTDRRHAVEALGKIGNPRTVRTLTKALKDEHVNVRVSAAIALGKIGDPAALPALTEALNDTATTEVNAPTTPADEARKAIDAIKGKKSEAKRDD